ncbi:DNA topoisomerase 3-alpha [Trifolium repens]|nr:DNA topoisomerase 3-alpha [Trifolium repens]
MQILASKYLSMTSSETIEAAQYLYTKEFISYPRIETDMFSIDINLRAIVEEQKLHPKCGAYAHHLLDLKYFLWRDPARGRSIVHQSIHPTKVSSYTGLNEHQINLYDLIVRHFLARVSKPAVIGITSVEIIIDDQSFFSRGIKIQKIIPELLIKTKGENSNHYLTEEELLTRMKVDNIGTAATMHVHIENLLKHNYVRKDHHMCFRPTELSDNDLSFLLSFWSAILE